MRAETPRPRTTAGLTIFHHNYWIEMHAEASAGMTEIVEATTFQTSRKRPTDCSPPPDRRRFDKALDPDRQDQDHSHVL